MKQRRSSQSVEQAVDLNQKSWQATKSDAMRRRILDAAAVLVMRTGITSLTISLVAKEAGVSKGGVLHHFATKQALINGLIRRVFDDLTYQIEQEMIRNQERGAWSRAFITVCLSKESPMAVLVKALNPVLNLTPEIAHLEEQYYAYALNGLQRDGFTVSEALIIALTISSFIVAEAPNVIAQTKVLRTELLRQVDEVTKRDD
ncbi:MAG: TetR/AcrR family transcriptional regulator [Chloroflexota bacterium]